MKSVTKQLAIAAFILISVTVLSFGIRQVRLNNHRANTIENPIVADTGETSSAHPSGPENQPQRRRSLHANAEPDHYPADSHTVDAEPDPQHANAPDSDKDAPSDDQSEPKSFKGDYAKSEGSKGLERISLSDNENLYITPEGQVWYVNKQPDGSTAKMQVQINNTTGEMTIVGGGNYAKSEGSQTLQRISMGDREDLYITPEDELWYVSKQPDGSTAKMQLQTESINGEIAIVDRGEMNVYPANDGKAR